jgi:preprotein translocase subunit SecG
VFTARRGVERTLFRLTIILSIIFFALVIFLVLAGQ